MDAVRGIGSPRVNFQATLEAADAKKTADANKPISDLSGDFYTAAAERVDARRTGVIPIPPTRVAHRLVLQREGGNVFGPRLENLATREYLLHVKSIRMITYTENIL
jgi:hypothetical protein